MKFLKFFSASMLMLAFAACGPTIPPEGPTEKPDEPEDTTTVVIPENVDIPEGAITVAEAREICAALASEATTGTKYYVKGWVKKLHSKHTQETIDQYGNGQFYMVDNIGDSDDFLAYQVYGLNGQKLVSVDQVEVGDYVVIYGELTNYNGTYETVGKGAAYIYSSSNPKLSEGAEPVIPDEYIDVTIPEAIEIANALTAGSKTSEYYRLKDVIVDQIFTTADKVATYGNINLQVKDAEGNTFSSYYTNNIDNVKFTSATQIPAVGATVTIVGPLKNYVKGDTTSPEFENGWFTAISEVAGGEEPEPTPEPEIPTAATVSVTETGAIVLDFATNPLSLTAEWAIKGSASFALGETGITMTLDGSGNTSSGTKVLLNQFRMYKSTTFTLVAPDGKNITNIAFETAGTVGSSNYSCSNMSVVEGGGEITIDGDNAANAVWAGSANTVKFTNNNQVRINKITITME